MERAGVQESAPAHGKPELRQVYQAHFTHVWHTLRRLGVAERDLEDLAHEVFVVVHRRLDSYDPARPIRPWLTGIAYRVASDQRRRAHHQRELLDDPAHHVDGAPGPEEQAAAEEDRRLVLQALLVLPPERRIVFVMHELDGCDMPEIAEALEVPLNTCYSRLRLARKQFLGAARRLRRDGGPR